MTSQPSPEPAPGPRPDGDPHCLVEQRGHVLVVTMNRPAARNALSAEMTAIMREAWDRVDADDDIRACVLTGAGGAFCAGADLKAMTASHPGDSFSGGANTAIRGRSTTSRRPPEPERARATTRRFAGDSSARSSRFSGCRA